MYPAERAGGVNPAYSIPPYTGANGNGTAVRRIRAAIRHRIGERGRIVFLGCDVARCGLGFVSPAESMAARLFGGLSLRSESALPLWGLGLRLCRCLVVRMPDYRRNRVPGGTFFFTVALLERKRDLWVSRIDLLRDSVRRVKRLYPFESVAWVVLPDHLHCIWTLPPGDADYPTRWRLIKLPFAKGLPADERLSAVRRRRGERGIWHRRYWEHTIRDEQDLAAHIDYIHANPVKHGWAETPHAWPYSRFHRYVTAGILPADWMIGSERHLPVTTGEDEPA